MRYDANYSHANSVARSVYMAMTAALMGSNAKRTAVKCGPLYRCNLRFQNVFYFESTLIRNN